MSIDLKLDENTLGTWSNIFGFNVAGVQTFAVGGRIPAAFVVPGKNRLHICSAIGDRNDCWNSREYKVGEWFNLKIKENFKICHGTSTVPVLYRYHNGSCYFYSDGLKLKNNVER